MKERIDLDQRIGLHGQELVEFVCEQQQKARCERHEEAELRRDEEERDAELRREERQHELVFATLSIAAARDEPTIGVERNAAFVDGKYNLNSYLQKFERFVRTNNWEQTPWASALSALLSGRALDVYSILAEDVASAYQQLKQALLKRYNLTENSYRMKFRLRKPESGESPEQYLFRSQSYLE